MPYRFVVGDPVTAWHLLPPKLTSELLAKFLDYDHY